MDHDFVPKITTIPPKNNLRTRTIFTSLIVDKFSDEFERARRSTGKIDMTSMMNHKSEVVFYDVAVSRHQLVAKVNTLPVHDEEL